MKEENSWGFKETSDFANYSQVPFYRKRWFFVLSFLFCIPLMMGLAFSGNIYANIKDKVFKYPKKTIQLMAVAGLFIMLGNLRFFLSNM